MKNPRKKQGENKQLSDLAKSYYVTNLAIISANIGLCFCVGCSIFIVSTKFWGQN